MEKIDIGKLFEIIEKEKPDSTEQMLFKDMFSVSCYLSLKGEHVASRKLCREIFKVLGYDNRETYFQSILATMQGNEVTYQSAMPSHVEINHLFHGHRS